MPSRLTQADFDAQITAEGLVEQEKLLEEMPTTMNRFLTTAVRKGTTLVRKTEVPRVTRFTGATSDSIRSSVKTLGIGSVRGVIGPNRKRAYIFRFMQSGREAGKKQPWIEDLLEWVEKKWGTTGNETRKAAYVLARSIREKGIQPNPIAKPVIEETKGQIIAFIKAATDEIVARLVVKK